MDTGGGREREVRDRKRSRGSLQLLIFVSFPVVKRFEEEFFETNIILRGNLKERIRTLVITNIYGREVSCELGYFKRISSKETTVEFSRRYRE